VSKIPFTAILVAAIVGGIGFLAFDPDAARDLSNWIKRQVGNDVPDPKKMGHPGYALVVPVKGL
jgi:hypothetical protein